ncbi:TetR/AcrR family transcriptional regulator [Methylocystis echinoides]|jgi:AcrR family transcriptional regulator|uniref:TetR/AcrR family transcriptional regulator n=1 Tax=Methylocystis echinoides TaxID=29468 RepID=UPI00341273BC
MQVKRGYHHGSLKQALVDAGVELLAEGGPAALTLTEAARRAGVTPAAPYRHFSGRDALLAEIARQGFETFGDKIEAAWNEGRPDARTAMRAMCAAYLAFAREETGLYAAMFGQAATLADPQAGGAADHALEILWRAVVAWLQQAGAPAQGARHVALQIWALAHGVAMLTISGHFDAAKTADPMMVLEGAVEGVMAAAVGRTAGTR